MKIKKSAMFIAALLCIGVIAGCGKGDTAVDSEAVTLSWWCKNATSGYINSYSDIEAFKVAGEKCNVNIDFIHPIAGQEAEQFNVVVASGDYPDIVEYNWAAYQGGILKAVSDKVIISLDEYINEETMPNFYKILMGNDEYRKELKNSDGSISIFPCFNESLEINPYIGPTIRQDWLDKLGLDIPETIDDWHEVLKAFKTGDPNGNGEADEIPFVDDSNGCFRFFAGAWGTSTGLQLDEDGKVIYAPAYPEYKEWLETMTAWYAEGLIDQEYASQNRKNIDYKMTSDIGGAYVGFTGSQMGNYISSRKNDGTSYKLVAAPWPKGVKGKAYCGYDGMRRLMTASTGAAITTQNKHIDRTMKLFDYMYSEEGIILRNYGIEGVSYNKTENGYEYTDAIMKPANGEDPVKALAHYAIPNWGSAGTVMLNDTYDKISRSLEEQKHAAEIWAQGDMSLLLPTLSFTAEESEVISDTMADITTCRNEFTTKVILGAESIDGWDNYIAKIKSMGVDKLEAVYQAAYDRYLNY